MELHGHVLRIDHRVLGAAGVDAEAVYGHDGSGSIEVLIFQFAQCATVYGIRIIRSEQLHIKMIRSGTDFLIRGKTNADLAMLFLRMF